MYYSKTKFTVLDMDAMFKDDDLASGEPLGLIILNTVSRTVLISGPHLNLEATPDAFLTHPWDMRQIECAFPVVYLAQANRLAVEENTHCKRTVAF